MIYNIFLHESSEGKSIKIKVMFNNIGWVNFESLWRNYIYWCKKTVFLFLRDQPPCLLLTLIIILVSYVLCRNRKRVSRLEGLQNRMKTITIINLRLWVHCLTQLSDFDMCDSTSRFPAIFPSVLTYCSLYVRCNVEAMWRKQNIA